jgi:hypothetical protein
MLRRKTLLINQQAIHERIEITVITTKTIINFSVPVFISLSNPAALADLPA